MWVKAREREKNKEKHVNGAMFLTGLVIKENNCCVHFSSQIGAF
jgi:hypothetical protein